jgi:hypothetical protein
VRLSSYRICVISTLKQTNLVLDALQTVAFDPKLTVGAASETVTVTDIPPLLASEDVKLGSTIQNDTYDALPLG